LILTLQKEASSILAKGRAVYKRAKTWWLLMSDQEQRDAVMRGMTIGACAVAVSVALPAISVSYEHKRAEAEYRINATMFAELQDGGDVVRADPNSSALFDHPWMMNVEHALERDGEEALTRYSRRDRDGMALASVASFEPRHMDVAEQVDRDFECLSQAVYYEAGNEPREGQLAVAEVIANRVKDHRYPNTVCEVVYQGSTRTTGCQFTFTCDGALSRAPDARKYARAEEVAAHIMMDLHERRTSGATHYHATYVNPVWNSGLVRTTRIRTHIFYRFPRGGEWASADRKLAKRLGRSASVATVSSNVSVAKTIQTLTPAP